MTDGRDVTVVIPAYQAATTIAECITSALDQVPPPVEVIVVDDGSTDSTPDVLERFAGRISVIRQLNGGEAAARNAGLRAVRTEWVAFLDADDRFLPGRLHAVHAELEARPELDLVTTDAFLEVDGVIAGRCYDARWPWEEQHQRLEILRRNFIFGHIVARAEHLRRLGGFDESIRHTTDWSLWLRLILSGGVAGVVLRPLAIYRLHAASLSADRVAMARGGLMSLQSVDAAALDDLEREVLAEQLAAQHALVAREELAAALSVGARDLRTAASRLRRDRRQPTTSRAKAALIAVAPRLLAAAARRRRRHVSVGTLGRPVPREVRPTDVGIASGQPVRALVAVVVPIGDDAKALQATIDGVGAQTLGSWEMVLLDRPGGSAGSRAVADAAITADPGRVRHVEGTSSSASVLPSALRIGLDHSRSGTIIVLAPGEVLDTDALERRLSWFPLCSEAGVVADAASPTDRHATPTIEPAGRYASALASGSRSPPALAAVVFRRGPLDAALSSPLGGLVDLSRLLFAIGLRSPVIVAPAGESNPSGPAEHLRRWAVRYALTTGPPGWRVLIGLLRDVVRRVRHSGRPVDASHTPNAAASRSRG